jgi:hypothetical protein
MEMYRYLIIYLLVGVQYHTRYGVAGRIACQHSIVESVHVLTVINKKLSNDDTGMMVLFGSSLKNTKSALCAIFETQFRHLIAYETSQATYVPVGYR